jgi:hypothetical protein
MPPPHFLAAYLTSSFEQFNVWESFWASHSVFSRADERTRTADLLITSELLYLLSYVGL